MAKIVTLTPNPVLDIATDVERLIPERKMRCGPVKRDPGGGGVNVVRPAWLSFTRSSALHPHSRSS